MLGSAGGGGADEPPADDPVTSLDMFVGSDYLVAGHGSGQVFLWDYLRCGFAEGAETEGKARGRMKMDDFGVFWCCRPFFSVELLGRKT